jgi:protein TonB
MIPPVDMSAPAVNIEDFSGIGIAGGIAPPDGYVPPPAPPEPGTAGDSYAYEVAVLDSPPALQNVAAVQAAMQRAYPKILLDAGISGSVDVEFVVQADGTVDMSSIKIKQSSNERFVDASRDVIERFRFTPGKYKGQPVRVLIAMPIRWQSATM